MIDAHLHLDRFENPSSAWAKMRAVGIQQALIPGVEPPFEPAAICQQPGLSYALGLHPQFAAPADWQDQLRQGLDHHAAVAVGELGWDRRGGADLSRAIAQITLAKARQLPVILHQVGHCPELLRAVQDHGVRAQLHRCTGRPQRFQDYWEAGHFISIGPNLRGDLRLAQTVPVEQILLETDAESEADAPWLTLPRLYEEVAHARGLSVDALIAQVEKNYAAFLGRPS